MQITQLLQRLGEADIDFVIVGGYAAVLHGSSMVTRDLDVCMVLSASNVDKLRELFRDLHPTHRFTPQRLSFLDNPSPGTAMKNLYLQTDLGAVDFLSSIMGLGLFDEVKQGAIQVELLGKKFQVIGVQDLIKAKEALGREKDHITARELRAILAKNAHRLD
jgi:predicted nucleotidyltransferase